MGLVFFAATVTWLRSYRAIDTLSASRDTMTEGARYTTFNAVSYAGQAKTQPATMPATSRPGPIELMGVKSRGTSVVFVCDASGSMLNKFESLRRQLDKTIGALAPDQRFGIVLMQEEGSATLNTALLPATPQNVSAVDDFVVNTRFRGETNPIPAIETAFSMHPDVIYLVADGDFPDNDAVRSQIRGLNKAHRVRVDAVAFTGEGDPDTAFMKVLEDIATSNGGKYAHVAERELK